MTWSFRWVVAMTDVTRILSAKKKDDPADAEQLMPPVYDELRMLKARRMTQEKLSYP